MPAGGVGDVGGGGVGRRLVLDAVHVDDPDAGQTGHRRIDVARHAQVAYHQRLGCFLGFTAVRARQRVMHVGQRHHRGDRPGAG